MTMKFIQEFLKNPLENCMVAPLAISLGNDLFTLFTQPNIQKFAKNVLEFMKQYGN